MNAITVNHREIPEDMVLAEMQYHPAGSRQEAFQRAAEALVLRELLLQEAHAQAVLPVDNDEAELIDTLLAQVLPVPTPAEAECEAFYAAQASRFVDAEGQVLPYSTVAALIHAELQARAGRQALHAYLQALVARSRIDGLVMGQQWLNVKGLS